MNVDELKEKVEKLSEALITLQSTVLDHNKKLEAISQGITKLGNYAQQIDQVAGTRLKEFGERLAKLEPEVQPEAEVKTPAPLELVKDVAAPVEEACEAVN